MTDPFLFDQENKAFQHFQQILEMLASLETVWVQGEETRSIPVATWTTLQALVGETQRDYQKIYRQSARLVKLSDMQQEAITIANKALAKNQQSLEQQNLALVAAAELREDVDRIMRHDLKTPLTAIIGFSDFLSKTMTMDEEQASMINTVIDAGYTLLAMINLSLDLYKMERKSYTLTPKAMDLLPLIHKIFKLNLNIVQRKRIHVDIFLDGRMPEPSEHVLILGEELLCFSMLSNLIKNAIEASPDEGSITLSLWRGAAVKIAIRNQGSVPEAIRARFFEKYVTHGKKSGTGLGTYSARLMAETQHGTIHLDSTEAGATTVIVHLPSPA